MMKVDGLSAGEVDDLLVIGLMVALSSLLIAQGQSPLQAWEEVAGPSRIIALAMLFAIGNWIRDALRDPVRPSVPLIVSCVSAGAFVPIEYWAAAVLVRGRPCGAHRRRLR